MSKIAGVARGYLISLRRMRRWRSRRRPGRVRLGLAIGADRVVAVELVRSLRAPRPGRVWSAELAPPAEDGTWPDLTEALGQLPLATGAHRGTASIALLRPHARAKVITVPPVRRRDLVPLITRGLRRYFIAPAEATIVDAAPTDRPRRGHPVRAIATCAGAQAVRTIQDAVEEAGFRVAAITAAPLALARAVRQLIPATRRHVGTIATFSPEWREGMALERGRPILLEPWKEIEAGEVPRLVSRLASNAFASESTPKLIVLAGREDRARILAAMNGENAGGPPGEGLETLSGPELEPAALAAFGSALLPEDAPQLLPESLRRARSRQVTRRVVLLSAAALVAFVLAGALHLRGLQRELDRVAERRLDHAEEVARVLAMRETAEGIRARLEAIADMETSTQRWTPAVAALAEALPDSAYLVSLSAEGLQLRLAGVASSASALVPALEASPVLQHVSLTAARRSETGEGAESFDLALALRPVPGPLPVQPSTPPSQDSPESDGGGP